MISPYIVAIIISWIIAQGTKYVLARIGSGRYRQQPRRGLYMSGGMPSAHSASVIALLTSVAILDGADTSLFAAVALFSAIIIYDAVMVRRSSGEQGEALKDIVNQTGVTLKKPFFVAHGHSLLEVIVGGAVGAIVGVSVSLPLI